jgi:hypothetical protein
MANPNAATHPQKQHIRQKLYRTVLIPPNLRIARPRVNTAELRKAPRRIMLHSSYRP